MSSISQFGEEKGGRGGGGGRGDRGSRMNLGSGKEKTEDPKQAEPLRERCGNLKENQDYFNTFFN